jgi:hypothetical protein
MASLAALVTRLRAEYEALPGLKLTPAQVCHLWGVSEEICGSAMDALIEEGLLRRTATGAYIALPSPRAAVLKAHSPSPSLASALRCPYCRKLQTVAHEPAASGKHAALSFRCEACQRVVNPTTASA